LFANDVNAVFAVLRGKGRDVKTLSFYLQFLLISVTSKIKAYKDYTYQLKRYIVRDSYTRKAHYIFIHHFVVLFVITRSAVFKFKSSFYLAIQASLNILAKRFIQRQHFNLKMQSQYYV